jgi:hypothetical protein
MSLLRAAAERGWRRAIRRLRPNSCGNDRMMCRRSDARPERDPTREDTNAFERPSAQHRVQK